MWKMPEMYLKVILFLVSMVKQQKKLNDGAWRALVGISVIGSSATLRSISEIIQT